MRSRTSLNAALALMLVCTIHLAASGQVLKARDELQIQRPVVTSAEVRTRLTEIAQTTLAAHNQLLVSGQVDPDTAKSTAGKAARAVIEGNVPDALDVHNNMTANYLTYTGFQTDLTVKSLRISGSAAVMEATEHTVLDLSLAHIDPLAPEVTKYDQDHIFTFALRKNQWVLLSDRLVNTTEPTAPRLGDPIVPEGMPSTDTTWTNTPAPEVEQPKVRVGKQTTPMAALSTLNRTAIVNYAYRYATNYNSTYLNYDGQSDGGDCTNFVSQALYAGGWTYVRGFYTLNYVWWFDSKWIRPAQSYTWVNANLWFQFINSRPRGTLARNIRDLVPGDILQADWNRDGHIDHSMIVTKKDSMGNIYLTYHSNNTVDKPFSALPTNATYYGWRLYTYPN